MGEVETQGYPGFWRSSESPTSLLSQEQPEPTRGSHGYANDGFPNELALQRDVTGAVVVAPIALSMGGTRSQQPRWIQWNCEMRDFWSLGPTGSSVALRALGFSAIEAERLGA